MGALGTVPLAGTVGDEGTALLGGILWLALGRLLRTALRVTPWEGEPHKTHPQASPAACCTAKGWPSQGQPCPWTNPALGPGRAAGRSQSHLPAAAAQPCPWHSLEWVHAQRHAHARAVGQEGGQRCLLQQPEDQDLVPAGDTSLMPAGSSPKPPCASQGRSLPVASLGHWEPPAGVWAGMGWSPRLLPERRGDQS